MMKGKKTAAKKPAAKKYNVGGLTSSPARSFGQGPVATPTAADQARIGQTTQNNPLLSAERPPTKTVEMRRAPARQMPPSQRALPKRRGPVEMAKGGAVKGKKPAAGVAIMIAMPAKGKGKTKMAMGGCATKKK